MFRKLATIFLIGTCWIAAAMAEEGGSPEKPRIVGTPLDGYRGIWYENQRIYNPYKWKYSGGLGTYCAKHIPVAYYAKDVDKTFFVYGGTTPEGHLSREKRTLLIMASYYDHNTGQVPQPTMLMDKRTADAHDNPVLMLDDKGHVWVFAAAHGTARPAYIFRSVEPYSVEKFEEISKTNFSYPQPWFIPGEGFLFLHTRYTKKGRELYQMTSPDGREWSEPAKLAGIDFGHYQISFRHGKKVATAFNMHPKDGGLNSRTNLYYMETEDFGKTWKTASGKKLDLPLTEIDNPALVRSYSESRRLVYLKDLTFDGRGNPVILYLTGFDYRPGPSRRPRVFTTARWTGRNWELNGTIWGDNNYDTGCLHVEAIDRWVMMLPSDTGPQPYNPGGEVVMWLTKDLGRSWYKKPLTEDSEFNHTYVRRPVNADPDFYAYWADGHGRDLSKSRLYFANQEGDVFRLPWQMSTPYAKPEKLPSPARKSSSEAASKPASTTTATAPGDEDR